MRFSADGPSIPDELLVARDEGRAIFFCGAGVSRARANLPDFFGLAERVITMLGATADSPARKLISHARGLRPIDGVGSLVSADRVFSLLEREFLIPDITREVATALRPPASPDLSAHRILLELSRSPDGTTRLVTTNFDLLFEACNSKLPKFKPPRLPDPLRQDEFVGIVHLHGHVDEAYRGAAGDGFVLSSAEFGRAYLSEGWATQFIRAVTEEYSVVFVGYAADDPPVQYLLEALNRAAGTRTKLFAFQPGSEGEAESRWRHKGVQPIAYTLSENHHILWETLEAWAKRARNPAAWLKGIVRRAGRGPEVLLPHERGQVVHLAMTLDGAREFESAKRPPPGEWLCVFDPMTRYSKPGRSNYLSADAPFVDPFDAYGIDTDPVPAKIAPNDYSSKREIPKDARDVFASTEADQESLRGDRSGGFRGPVAIAPPELPPRLRYLGAWIAKLADQPAALWWAAGQYALHPAIQAQIKFQLQQPQQRRTATAASQAWEHLFESWRVKNASWETNEYELGRLITQYGWTAGAIRTYVRAHRPYVRIERSFWRGPMPPSSRRALKFRDVLRLEVEYPKLNITVPDECLSRIVPALRLNLEHAIELETEGGSFQFSHICPIEPDPEVVGQSAERDHGLSMHVIQYVTLLRRLIEVDRVAARREFISWRRDEDVVFARLRIWSCGEPQLTSNEEAARVLSEINAKVFWGDRHQRDLLLVLGRRWSALSGAARQDLERRLKKGPTRWRREDKTEYRSRHAWAILDRLYWLRKQACEFSFDIDGACEPLRKIVPQWQPNQAERASASRESRGGYVQTDTSYTELLKEPLVSLVQRAAEFRGRRSGFLTEHDPFAGLAAERPVRALAAIMHASIDSQSKTWAWQSLLSFQARKSDKPAVAALIARRIVQLSEGEIAGFLRSVTFWLGQSRKLLFECDPEVFDLLFAKIAPILRSPGDAGSSSMVRQRSEPDWVSEAINSPSGQLAEALLDDPKLKTLTIGTGLPKRNLDQIESLLELPEDVGRYALVIFARSLNWYFAIDPSWTCTNLLGALRKPGSNRDAFLSGFLWYPAISGRTLFEHLKPTLLLLARGQIASVQRHEQALADVLLDAWCQVDDETHERWVSDDELRVILVEADDHFRTRLLWRLGHVSTLADKLDLLTRVWPKQTSAKSPAIAARLCDLAFGDKEHFSELVDAIIPLITKVGTNFVVLPGIRDPEGQIITRFPEKVLALLWEILGPDASTWPYGTIDSLHRIGDASASLVQDVRFVELQRRWNARQI